MLTRWRTISPLFLALVALPTFIATIYFAFLADDIYVSESRFIVRSTGKPSASPLGQVLGASSLLSATDEMNAVTEYLQSRSALEVVNEDGFIEKVYSDGGIFVFDRFGTLGSSSFEHLFTYFLGKVTVEQGESLQTLRLTVEAYDADDAREINERLLQGSEKLVNDLSERARADAISFSQEEVAKARETARAASVALARFRDQEDVIDPELEAEIGLQTIAQLQDRLTSTKARLEQMRAFTPKASQIPYLQTQVDELEKEIESQTAKITGSARSLSANSVRFQELTLASELAEKQLAFALSSLQEAQTEASRQQAYVERISEPSEPDYPIYPRRIRGVFATLILGLLAWGVLSMLLVGIREHQD